MQDKTNWLVNLVEQGESATVEFKKSTGQRTEAAKTLCGMANTNGGTVLFGVTPEGKVVGQSIATKTLEDIAQELRKFEPLQFPQIEQLPLADSTRAMSFRVAS
jgi:ATP-dependent DNA helicase RecG